MSDYRKIALLDLEEAIFSYNNKRYRSAAFFFQQFAEKSAKALLHKKDPEHRQLKSHAVEKILEAYDEAHKVSEIGDKARYLTGFNFIVRNPGDDFMEVSKAQAERAKNFSEDLDLYFKAELEALTASSNDAELELESLPPLNLSKEEGA